ncbi:MAG: flagellin [Opitutae bacterium]|nr:flagellin [Opitutae bacterium]|tara:strand:+ start:2843 stop:3808 length:966 start_codon:yes stop_codon:yes gene_type:complete
MPVVVNSNATATASSFNLSRANDALRKSLERLSTGKRINSAADDAGGLSVAYKLNSKMNRTSAIIQNSQNALSYLQVQDSSLSAAGKIVDRMAELRTMAQDITKNTGDIENYSKEFIELQSQLNQISKEKFNGISLFGNSSASAVSGGVLNTGTASFGSAQYTTLSRTLTTHDSGSTESGSVSINVVNFQFMLSINSSASGGTGLDLGNINGSNSGGASEVNSNGYIIDIKEVSVSQFTDIISRIADMRAENGAEQNRVMQRIDLLQSNLTNIEAAHGRIMDADIALESTRFARHNILVQASASMTAQANQLSSVALSLIG